MNKKTFEELKAEFLAMGSISEEVAENLARDELARLNGEAVEHDFQVDEIAERPTIRQILEPAFIEGGFNARYDAIQILDEHDIFLTPQNVKSALRKHIMPGHRLSVKAGERFFDVCLVEDAKGARKANAPDIIKAERERMCAVIDAIYKDAPPSDRAIAMALKMLINNKGEK